MGIDESDAADRLLIALGDTLRIEIEPIARALARQCRFNGRCKAFYSVAQHSVEVSRRLDDDVEAARWGLLHDAAEAWTGDLVRPLKRLLFFGPPFHRIECLESELLRRVAERFSLDGRIMPERVAVVDDRMLATEARDLGLPHVLGTLDAAPYPEALEPQGWVTAEIAFLRRFRELESRRMHHGDTEARRK